MTLQHSSFCLRDERHKQELPLTVAGVRNCSFQQNWQPVCTAHGIHGVLRTCHSSRSPASTSSWPQAHLRCLPVHASIVKLTFRPSRISLLCKGEEHMGDAAQACPVCAVRIVPSCLPVQRSQASTDAYTISKAVLSYLKHEETRSCEGPHYFL